MACILKQKILNRHYIVLHNGSNLGDVFYDEELRICKVRFYGWFPGGEPLSDLVEVVTEIKILEQAIKDRTRQGGKKF